MLDIALQSVSNMLMQIDGSTAGLDTWLSDDTDMAALANFGQDYVTRAITQEDLDTQHLDRFYDLTDFMFDAPWATSILRDEITYACLDAQGEETNSKAASLPVNALLLHEWY